MEELPRHYRVYLPRPGSRYEQLIDPGSGIVGTLESSGDILLDYEGNRYSSPGTPIVSTTQLVGTASVTRRSLARSSTPMT